MASSFKEEKEDCSGLQGKALLRWKQELIAEVHGEPRPPLCVRMRAHAHGHPYFQNQNCLQLCTRQASKLLACLVQPIGCQDILRSFLVLRTKGTCS